MKIFLILSLLFSQIIAYSQNIKPKCIEGNCKNKIGTYLYSDSSIYVGSFTDKLRNGQGKITYKSGATYEGEWLNDKRHGKGVLVDSLKNRYEGAWLDDRENGVGKYTDAKGNVYEGTWTNGELKGYITLRYRNKNVYVGEYDKGLKGKGKFTYADGSEYTGNFNRNKRSGYGELIYHFGLTYKGNWVSNEIEGQGDFFETKSQKKLATGLWKTEKSDEGHLIYSSDNGYMVCYYKNKDLYYGQVSKGLPNGNGMMVYSNGEVYEGKFVAGKYDGYGRYLYNDKSEYKGEWKNGLREGFGTLVKKDKSEEKGYWEKGKFINSKPTNNPSVPNSIVSSGSQIFFNIIPTKNKVYWLGYSPVIGKSSDCYGYILGNNLLTNEFYLLRRQISEYNTNRTCDESISVFRNNPLLNQTNVMYRMHIWGDKFQISEKKFNTESGAYNDVYFSPESSFESNDDGGNISTYTRDYYQIGNGFGAIYAKDKLAGKGFIFIDDYRNQKKISRIDLSKLSPKFYSGHTYEMIRDGKKELLYIQGFRHVIQNDKYFYVFLNASNGTYSIPIRINKSNNSATVIHESILNMGTYTARPNTNIFESNHGLFFLPYSQGFAHYYIFQNKTTYERSLLMDIYDQDFKKLSTINLDIDKNIKWVYEKDNYLIIGGYTTKSGYLGYHNPWIKVINKTSELVTYEKVIAHKNGEVQHIASDGTGGIYIGIGSKCCDVPDTDREFKSLIIIDKLNSQGKFVNDLDTSNVATKMNQSVINNDIKSNVVESKPTAKGGVIVEPSYPNGVSAMMSFIQKNLKYPASDLANNVSGKVEVTFTVESDGSLTNIKITKGLTETTNNEVIRVIKLMPKWIAGTIDGKKSSLDVTIPVKFSF